MKFHVGQWVKVLGPYWYGSELVVQVLQIDECMEYPIIAGNKKEDWMDAYTVDGLLFSDEPKDKPGSVYLEPLTKLERLLLGLE